MKTTGISRRIDDLGRIVIPKEIRKNLKIRNGELLEIMVEDEKIILSKHSAMKNINDIAKLCVEAVNDSINVNIIITDRDKVIAASPHLRKKYIDKELNIEINELLLKYTTVIEKEPKVIKIDNDNEEYSTYISQPIIADGDVVGLVIILGLTNKITEIEEKVADIISKILMHNIL